MNANAIDQWNFGENSWKTGTFWRGAALFASALGAAQ